MVSSSAGPREGNVIDPSAALPLAMMRIGLPGALAALLWASPSPAQTTFLLQCVTQNSLADCAIGESQLSLGLDDPIAGNPLPAELSPGWPLRPSGSTM